jgi:hypothetical protein
MPVPSYKGISASGFLISASLEEMASVIKEKGCCCVWEEPKNFFMGLGFENSSLHTCKASTVLFELYFQSIFLWLF